jgi:dihydrofolate synthase/folylpolyglutamate synthase
MNYSQCLEYLYRLGNEVLTMKFGLETTRSLLQDLGNPHHDFPSVLIAGTNGKGSVARFLNSICQAAGLRTGLYTSPHLIRMEERIVVDDLEITPESFARHFSSVVDTVGRLELDPHPTFFELVTVTAFTAFSEADVDIAILEVGMGGRLDSTNVVDPILSVITPISYDHQQFLGASLAEIAREKAGILRPARKALSAPQSEEVWAALKAESRKIDSDLQMVDLSDVRRQPDPDGRYSFSFDGDEYQLSTRGKFQVDNACLALEAAKLLRLSLPLDFPAFLKAVETAKPKAVLQKVGSDPLTLLDGGHNTQAASSLARFVRDNTSRPRTLILGMMQDKEINSVVDKLEPEFDKIHLTRVDSPRAASLDSLRSLCPTGVPFDDPWEAYISATDSSSTVVVAGSIYLAGYILDELERERVP